MELVLPNNYVEIEEDEMMYLDGGSWSTFNKNMRGAFNRFSNLSRALKTAGWTYGYLGKMLANAATYGYWWAVANFGFPVVKIATIVAGVIGGIVAASGVTAGVWYLYNNRVFY